MNSDKNNIILYLKKPKTWFIIFGLISVIILFYIIYKLLKTTPPPPLITCNSPQVVQKCPDNTTQCADVCENGQSWDCTTQKCSCSTGSTPCEQNTKCCSTCKNDLCCTQQIKKDDKYTCCSPGTVATKDGTECVAACGDGSCNPYQECVVITNLTQKQADDMQTQSGSSTDWKGSSCTVDGCTVSLCSNPTQCVWDATATSVPSPIGDFHPYYNMDFYGTDWDTLCLPKTPTDPTDTSCLDKTSQTDCSDSCTWTQILPYFNTYPSATQTLLTNWQQKNGKSPLGYYCGDGTEGSFMRLEQVTDSSNKCIWSDCVTRISNPGTTQVLWDQDNNICSALIGGSDGGIGSSVICTGVGSPCSLCTSENVGQQVECVKCNGAPTYTPSSECKSSNWEFKKCVEPITINGNTIYPEVLNYSCIDCAGETCSTTNNGYYCGNCPWGGNNSNDTQDYIINSDNKQVYGQTIDTKVCSNNNQFIIDPKTTTYYSSQPSKSGHGTACVIDPNCTTATDKCFQLQSQCEQANPTCDNTNGWFLNSDRNDCNIFACTTDGSLMNTNCPSGSLAPKNNDLLFTYSNTDKGDGDCWRKPPLHNPSAESICTLDFMECRRNSPPPDPNGWQEWDCEAHILEGASDDCYAAMRDDTPPITEVGGGPKYHFLNVSQVDDGPFYPCYSADSASRTSDKPIFYGGNMPVPYSKACPSNQRSNRF